MPAAASIPPTDPAMLPMPVTEPTACRGNVSETSVNKFADQPWCAAAARLMMTTVLHKPGIKETKHIGTTHKAQTSSAPPGELEDDPVYRRHRDDWARYHTRHVRPDDFANGLMAGR